MAALKPPDKGTREAASPQPAKTVVAVATNTSVAKATLNPFK